MSIIVLFAIGEGPLPLHLTRIELVLFLFFPLGTSIGSLVGWRQPLLGGGLAVSSLSAFYLLHLAAGLRFPSGTWVAIFTLPGFLFLLVGVWGRARGE